MATTKNALIRYKYLDLLLSDRHHYYDINDLTKKVNDMLYDDGFKTVTRRCIEKDLVCLTEAPFRAPIGHFKKSGKNCIAYEKASFSIFKQEMSREERTLLREVLNTIGRFEGLDNFEWLEKFKAGLGHCKQRQIISFSNNPYLKNTNLLGTLFDYISNKVVIRLSYYTFSEETVRGIEYHPYLLKQYNDRWYLIGAADKDMKVLHFALDRIDQVEPLPEKKYVDCEDDLTERFEDIVGVTLYKDRPVEHILCWVSDTSKGYVDTKPIHGSYTPIKGDKELKLRTEYPQLQGGMFFTLDCIKNYELIRELCSFGKELVVLLPSSIQDNIYNRINSMLDSYSVVRT
ncbi:MAG: WYL domain-containing protein [Bacteroidales bacterium]|nr:WYL domain-containing protein [Bacteroidales bacterium]